MSVVCANAWCATAKYFLLFFFPQGFQEVPGNITSPEPKCDFAIRFCPSFTKYMGHCRWVLAIWALNLFADRNNLVDATSYQKKSESSVLFQIFTFSHHSVVPEGLLRASRPVSYDTYC